MEPLGGEGERLLSGYILERGLVRLAQMYDRHTLECVNRGGVVGGRQIVLPHFLALTMPLEGSELLAIVPHPLARTFARTLGFMIKPLPYPVARPSWT